MLNRFEGIRFCKVVILTTVPQHIGELQMVHRFAAGILGSFISRYAGLVLCNVFRENEHVQVLTHVVSLPYRNFQAVKLWVAQQHQSSHTNRERWGYLINTNQSQEIHEWNPSRTIRNPKDVQIWIMEAARYIGRLDKKMCQSEFSTQQ